MLIFAFQLLTVGADPLLKRFDMNGVILSQIQCAPQSAFSISLHPAGVCSDLKLFPIKIKMGLVTLLRSLNWSAQACCMGSLLLSALFDIYLVHYCIYSF